MKTRTIIWLALLFVASTAISAFGQQASVVTGTALIYGQGRDLSTHTLHFRININKTTSDADAERFLKILKSDGQDALQKAIGKEDLGTFSLNGEIGLNINAVRVQELDGKRKVYIVFERWLGTAEVRYGYRSLDYPFSYIELTLDKETGKGEGIYFAAAKIRWQKDKTDPQIEVENFATFPSKLRAVQMTGRKL